MCNFFFCHYVLQKLSAAEASENVYMRERVNATRLVYICEASFKKGLLNRKYSEAECQEKLSCPCFFTRPHLQTYVSILLQQTSYENIVSEGNILTTSRTYEDRD